MRAPATSRQVFDAADPSGGDGLGDLPVWRLEDLYPGMESEALTADISWLETECAAFAADYQGKLADTSGADLAAVLGRYPCSTNSPTASSVH